MTEQYVTETKRNSSAMCTSAKNTKLAIDTVTMETRDQSSSLLFRSVLLDHCHPDWTAGNAQVLV